MTAWRLKPYTCLSWLAAVAAWVGCRPVEYTLHERFNSARRRSRRNDSALSADHPGLKMGLDIGLSDRTHASSNSIDPIVTAVSADTTPTTHISTIDGRLPKRSTGR